jgi:antitoxin component YwqK of YwqJK toxin-antitoxin module
MHYPKSETYFYPDGTLKTVEPRKKGRLHGEAVLYWPNGKVKRRCQFQEGKRVGWDRMWSEEGVLVDEEWYG